jgi:DNA mismatch endonuclease (patch repair protein)
MNRSEQMARIRGRNTRPEIRLRQQLWRRGLRYRVNSRLAFGRPDIAIKRKKAAIFIDGCFWHGCPDHYFAPKSGAAFWAEKLRTNVERDRRQLEKAQADGWRVIRVWEHDIRADPSAAAEAVMEALEELDKSGDHEDWRVTAVSAGPEGREVRHLLELRTGRERTSSKRPTHAPAPSSI